MVVLAIGRDTGRDTTDDMDSLFEEIADELLYHGDPDTGAPAHAQTCKISHGRVSQVQGLRELMQRFASAAKRSSRATTSEHRTARSQRSSSKVHSEERHRAQRAR